MSKLKEILLETLYLGCMGEEVEEGHLFTRWTSFYHNWSLNLLIVRLNDMRVDYNRIRIIILDGKMNKRCTITVENEEDIDPALLKLFAPFLEDKGFGLRLVSGPFPKKDK